MTAIMKQRIRTCLGLAHDLSSWKKAVVVWWAEPVVLAGVTSTCGGITSKLLKPSIWDLCEAAGLFWYSWRLWKLIDVAAKHNGKKMILHATFLVMLNLQEHFCLLTPTKSPCYRSSAKKAFSFLTYSQVIIFFKHWVFYVNIK